MIGAKRAPRDFFAPLVGFGRWVTRQGSAAAERNNSEARIARKTSEEGEK